MAYLAKANVVSFYLSILHECWLKAIEETLNKTKL